MKKGGRPSKYNYDSVIQKYNTYITRCEGKYEKVLKTIEINSDGSIEKSFENQLKNEVPTISGFAKYCSLSRETIYAWAKKYSQFSDILQNLKNKQIQSLVSGKSNNRDNASITLMRLFRLGYGKVKI